MDLVCIEYDLCGLLLRQNEKPLEWRITRCVTVPELYRDADIGGMGVNACLKLTSVHRVTGTSTSTPRFIHRKHTLRYTGARFAGG